MSRFARVAPIALLAAVAAACTTAGTAPTPAASAPSASVPAATTAAASASTAVPSAAATAVATAAPTAAPTAPPTEAASIAASSAAASSSSAGASGSAGVTTTTVDWGEIWDALPPSFPAYPGAEPTVTGGGPASAILDVPADGPTASTWYQTALKGAGFTVDSANGPREDGSFLVDATSTTKADCKTEVNLAPLGSTTTATIYVAAACPFK
jgi:hypothetical protein